MMTGNGNRHDAMPVMPNDDRCQVGNPDAVEIVMIEGNVAVSKMKSNLRSTPMKGMTVMTVE